MSLITLFSALKPFTDPRIAVSQRNAVQSWKRLGDVDVLLLGDEAGIAEAAKEIGVRHLPQVARNQNGTPLISSMFEVVRKNSSSPLLCIINADMVLAPDFFQAANEVGSLEKAADGAMKNFVLVEPALGFGCPCADPIR